MKRIITITYFVLACISAFSQNRTVSGTVADTKGVPVMGAVVMLEGNSSIGALTDVEGKYTISFPASKNVVFNVSCIGYKTITAQIGKDSVVNFTLEDDYELLEQVVVVGYGSMRRSDLTGSVASVKIDDEEAARNTSVDQMLQGRASGVQVLNSSASPDAGVSIRIRGLNTFEGGSEPLYVVDGIMINGSSSSQTQMSAGGTENSSNEEMNGLMGINTQDIASIEILKDASATAIYGSQGANGVILITTKTARKEKPVVRFNTGVDVSSVNNSIPMLSFDEYCDYLDARGRSLNSLFEDPVSRTGCKVTPVNWQDYTLRTAVSQRYYLSVSGRPKTLSYMFSIGYNDKKGIVRGTDVQQITARLNLTKDISKKLSVGTKTGFGYVRSSLASGANAKVSGSAASMMRSMLLYRPYLAAQDEDDEDVIDPEEEEAASGPDRWIKLYKNTRDEIRVTPSLFVQWKMTPWLTFKSTAGADYRSTEVAKFKPNRISRQVGSFASVSMFDQMRYNWDNMFMVDKKIRGGHSFSGTVGVSVSESSKNTSLSEAWRIAQDRAGLASMNGGVSPFTNTSYSVTDYSLASFLVRGIYNFRDRYVLTATYRLDGSSRFQDENKWASFPSFAFAWRMNQEPWFNIDLVSMAKLRLGWGQVGNQAIPSYRTLTNFSNGLIPDHTAGNESMTQVAVYNSNLANRKLKWETTQQLNAGIDIGLWKGRLTVSADFYNKETRDLLQQKNISRASGFSSMYVNQGNVLNRGFELSVDAVPVKKGDFEWSLGGNISLNRNRITYIGDGVERSPLYLTPDNLQDCSYFWGDMVRSSASSLAVLNIFIEGQPMGLFYGFKTAGTVREDEVWPGIGSSAGHAQPGDVKYLDLNNNGFIDDDDRTIIGNPNPVFTYGFSTSFSWKGLTLSAAFNGSYGNQIYNANNYTEFNTAKSGNKPYNVRREAFLQAWTPDNQNTVFPRLEYSDEYISDRYVEDGSFLRLASLSLSYNIPLTHKKVLKGLNIGISGGNLFVLTKYSEWDPEVNSFGSDIKRMGVDMGSYPGARTFSADIKFTF